MGGAGARVEQREVPRSRYSNRRVTVVFEPPSNTQMGGSPPRMFSRCSYEMAFDARTGPGSLETGRWIMSEDISRRKMLSLLGFGATLGFTLSGVLEPLEAEAQETTPVTPPAAAPLRPPEHAGGTGGHRDAPLAISDGARATVTLLRPLQQLQQLRRNSDPRREVLSARGSASHKRTREAYALLVRERSRNKSPRFIESAAIRLGAGIREGPLSACPHARWLRSTEAAAASTATAGQGKATREAPSTFRFARQRQCLASSTARSTIVLNASDFAISSCSTCTSER